MMSLVYLSSVVIIVSCFLTLSIYTATLAYAFHGNATEDALLENPGASSPSTGLACESGTNNAVVLNIIKTSRIRLNFQCVTDHTIV